MSYRQPQGLLSIPDCVTALINSRAMAQEFTFFAEIALYINMQHTCTLQSVQFNDAWLQKDWRHTHAAGDRACLALQRAKDIFLLKPSALAAAIQVPWAAACSCFGCWRSTFCRVQEYPECCGFVYQYARNLQTKLNGEAIPADENLSDSVARACCEQTDVFQLKNLSNAPWGKHASGSRGNVSFDLSAVNSLPLHLRGL